MKVSLFLLAFFGAFSSFLFPAAGYALGDAKTYGYSFGPNSNLFAVGNLPGVSFQIPQSWTGQISVPDTANDELFFWLFRAEKPSNDLISEGP